MGLTWASTGKSAVDQGLHLEKEHPEDRVVALAGNPNVGKSTVFNELTGLNQHTGNWPGKTVTNAQGRCERNGRGYLLVDLPGTYSLMAHSAEEECARDFICFGQADAVVVVCDATCLERNLNLVLQTLEITPRVVLCVNLMDEAKRKGIQIDLEKLSRRLSIPVVGASARSGKGLDELMERVEETCGGGIVPAEKPPVWYGAPLERAAEAILPYLEGGLPEGVSKRWAAFRLLDERDGLQEKLLDSMGEGREALLAEVEKQRRLLEEEGIPLAIIKDKLTAGLVMAAEKLGRETVEEGEGKKTARDRKLDRILTSQRTGIPIMLLLLAGILWLTIEGANYPSQLLSGGLFWLQERLTEFVLWTGAPDWVNGVLIEGVYRTLAWVVSVMLPPMAIFFPLFTLLEDFGYLPRVAFNLDHHFKKAHTCGKQALTMCMGFGCNAAGVVGCRIIDSPRERLIAILTNNFVPCNGRFAPPRKGKQKCYRVLTKKKKQRN